MAGCFTEKFNLHNVENFNYLYFTVNHLLEFVNSRTCVHSNTVEGFLVNLKNDMRKNKGVDFIFHTNFLF